MHSTFADCARALASQQRPGGVVLHTPNEMLCDAPQHGDSTTKAMLAATMLATRRGRVLNTVNRSAARTSSNATGTITQAEVSVPAGAMARLPRRSAGWKDFHTP